MSGESEERRARGAAEALLARRDRSVAEIRRHLARRRVSPEVAESVVEDLVGRGYLDDVALAQRFAEDRRARDGWGRERIVQRLRSLGVEETAIEAAFEGHGHREELSDALALLERRVPRPVDERGRRRAVGLLQRRGFDADLVWEAVARHAGTEDEDAAGWRT